MQCKATGSKDNIINLRNAGGTCGKVYDHIYNHNLDLLFCLDKDKNLYIIPLKDLKESGNTKSISLRTAPNVNHQGFETYKYLVKI